jgi:hypothetical protein
MRNFYYETFLYPESQAILMRLCALLRRLIHGEEADFELFDILIAGFVRLVDKWEVEPLSIYECVLVLRILQRLGYVGALSPVSSMLGNALPTIETLRALESDRTKLVAHINHALKAAQL